MPEQRDSNEPPSSRNSTASSGQRAAERPQPSGPSGFDGVTSFIGMRWEDPQTVRLEIRPELINRGGLLSGVVSYAMIDYCMGSTLWARTTEHEHIATISISVNYIQTAIEGEIVCRSELDRRNRSIGIMKSTVETEDGRVLVTAIGSYSIFPARKRFANLRSGEHSVEAPESSAATG